MLHIRTRPHAGQGWDPANSFNQAGDFHASDFSLFYGDIRANAETRVAAWRAGGGGGGAPACGNQVS